MTYINLDIRILHTLMYQVDLCYTDITLITYYFLNALYPCNVILYINAPVRIYGATYYSTTTAASDVVVAYNTSGPWNLMLSGHADY